MVEPLTQKELGAMATLPPGSRLLYKVLSGSHATNLATPTSDEDWRGVYQVPTRSLLGLRTPPDTVEAMPDSTYWELAHFARLCLKGNPNIMELLWIEPHLPGVETWFVTASSEVIQEIRSIRSSFFTTAMLNSYMGWVTKERRILAGPHYATMDPPPAKRASHLVRLMLGLKGALTDGTLTVHLEGEQRDLIMAIKRNEITVNEALFTLDLLKEQCVSLADKAKWPEPDPRQIEDIVIRARMEML